MEDFMHLAAERYSVRKYSDRQIEKEKLEKILEAANIAPTGHNCQPQKIYVVQSREGLGKLASLSPCTFGAPTVLLIAYDRDKDWKNPYESGVHSGEEDASIAATFMMLEAWELGIGSCWVNMFPNTKKREAFGLPENIQPVLLMPMGYAAEGSHPSHYHSEFPEKDTMVQYL